MAARVLTVVSWSDTGEEFLGGISYFDGGLAVVSPRCPVCKVTAHPARAASIGKTESRTCPACGARIRYKVETK